MRTLAPRETGRLAEEQGPQTRFLFVGDCCWERSEETRLCLSLPGSPPEPLGWRLRLGRVWPEARGGRIGSPHCSGSALLSRARGRRVSGSCLGQTCCRGGAREPEARALPSSANQGTKKASTKTVMVAPLDCLCKVSPGLPPSLSASPSCSPRLEYKCPCGWQPAFTLSSGNRKWLLLLSGVLALDPLWEWQGVTSCLIAGT